MKKAIFLDRDGTINVDKNYLYKIEDFEYLPGAVEGLKLLQDQGFLLIIVTNQSGIAREMYSEEQFHTLMQWMLEDLEKKGITITDYFYCPHHPLSRVKKYAINCMCRKPGLELFWNACDKYDIDLSGSYVIGDKERDVTLCDESDAQGIILYQSSKEDGNKHYIETGLRSAALWISRREDERMDE